MDAAFYGIYNDIFERTAIPEHAIHGLLGMQNKFGTRITTGGATGAYTMSAAHAYLAAGRFKTALVLGEEETALAISRNTGRPVVWITGVGEANEHSFAGKNHKNMSRIMSDYYAAHRAYEMAGIGDPKESIDIIELHDAFVHQLEISMAEFGLVPRGRADSLIEEGLMTPGGKYLVNPCGGLIYCGHAVGASNIMSAWSAREELISRNLKTALVHGTGSTIAQFTTCMILEHQ